MDTQNRNKAIIILLLLAACVFVIASKIKVSTDLSLFLPEPSNKSERLLHQQLGNGASIKLVFIALTGLPEDSLAEANKAFVAQLSLSPLFRKVVNQATSLGEEGLAFVEENRYLLSHQDLSEQFSVEGLQYALGERIRGLTSPQASLEKRYMRQDPTGEVLTLLEDWQGKLSKHKTPEQYNGVWFSEDLQRTLVLAEIKAAITNLDSQVAAIEEIRSVFQTVKQRIQAEELNIILTGPAAFAVESGEDIRSDVRLLTWLAVIFVTLFLLLVYRSAIMLFLVIAPLLTGIIAATAIILLVHDQIHGITLAFGITLAGVAVDYPIHLLTGFSKPGASSADYTRKVWPTLRLGVISTVIAYAAFLVSGFGGLQQLGLFTITGLITAALFSRWVLPMLLGSRKERPQGLVWLHLKLSVAARKARGMRILIPAFAVLAVVALSITQLPILHLNVDSLSPIKDARRAQGKLLRNDLGYWYGGRMLIVNASSKEKVLQNSEAIMPALDNMIAEGVMDGYDMAAQFIPSQHRQQSRLDGVSAADEIAKNLTLALKESPFKPGVFAPFTETLIGLKDQPLIDIEEFLTRDIGKRLEPLIFDFEDGAAGVVLLHGVADENVMRTFADAQPDVVFMHLKTSATELVARSVNRVAIIMLGCILAIYFILAINFKSALRPFKILVPTFSAAVVTAALLVFFDCPLSIFHLISLMLVVGLGLDYALFFNRFPQNAVEWNTTFKALWVCAVTTIMVFGILMLSQIPPLEAIGMTVGIGAALSIIFAAMWATVEDHGAVEATTGD